MALWSLCSTASAFCTQQRAAFESITTTTTVVSMSKNSDRAFIERHLEDAMNNDWRLFRAKLVAQEKAAQHEVDGKKPSNSSSPNAVESEVARQGQLGDLFAGAIQNIFHKSTRKTDPETSTAAAASSRPADEELFLGQSIAGQAADPFCSVAELPLWLDSSKTPRVSKHRWAHEIPHLEPGCVLLANEKLGGVFHQTVVLIIEHHETTGTFGVVINR